jgi:hypothetical protein
MSKKTFLYSVCAALLTCICNQAVADSPQYLKLTNNLDRPNDGYCFDVQGVVGHFRADKPLVAHNCKRGMAPDGLIEHKKNGLLFFPAFGLCVTAMGTANTVLPGTALMIKPCKEQGIFASLAIQKRFTFNKKGQLELTNSNLCVVVGDRSAHTLSNTDRWRTLYLDDCDNIPLQRSQWKLVSP